MKTYTTKFNREENPDVWIFINKTAIKSKINKVRISDNPDNMVFNGIEYKKQSGFKIEYLISGESKQISSDSTITPMEWYEEKDVYATKEELIASIQ